MLVDYYCRMAEKSTFVVTGGAGFVGSNLVAAIAKRHADAHVIVIDDFRSGSFANVVDAFERTRVGPFYGEVVSESIIEVDFEALIAATNPRAVFHLAAITDTTVSDESKMIRDNAESFGPILNACVRSSTPMVYASSAATYGSPVQGRDRVPFPIEAAGSPNNVYGFSKWLMECEHKRTNEAFEEDGELLPWVIGLRYFNVFGPGESRKGKMASMVYQLAKQMIEGKNPRVFEDGEQARDQVYVDDVVECTLAAAGLGGRTRPDSGIYNLGSGETTSFNAIIASVRAGMEMSEGTLATEYFPMPPDIEAFYQSYTCADMAQTENGLGWTPRFSAHEAIVEYVRYLRDHD